MCPPDDDAPGNPPVPTCPRCLTQHYPTSGCPTNPDGDGDGKDP